MAATLVYGLLETSTGITLHLNMRRLEGNLATYEKSPWHDDRVKHFSECSAVHKGLPDQVHNMSCDDGIGGDLLCYVDTRERVCSPMETASIFWFFLEWDFWFNTTDNGVIAVERMKERNVFCSLHNACKQWQCYGDFRFRMTSVRTPPCAFVPHQLIASQAFFAGGA